MKRFYNFIIAGLITLVYVISTSPALAGCARVAPDSAVDRLERRIEKVYNLQLVRINSGNRYGPPGTITNAPVVHLPSNLTNEQGLKCYNEIIETLKKDPIYVKKKL